LFRYFDDSYNAEEVEEIKNKIARHLKPTSNIQSPAMQQTPHWQ
jgi:hypothetical protein